MIELPPTYWSAAAARYPTGVPGPAIAVEHARRPGVARWWVDRLASPAAIAVACGGRLLLRGNARAFHAEEIAPFDGMSAVADGGFLPLLGNTFERVVPRERLVFVRTAQLPAAPVPAHTRIRRLDTADRNPLAAEQFAWLGRTWGGAAQLAESGRAWGAFRGGRLVSVACTYFEGTAYEDITAATLPEHRGQGLASACVSALGAEVAARGRTATWTCSHDNHAARRLARTAGFRLAREYVEYKLGPPRTELSAINRDDRDASPRAPDRAGDVAQASIGTRLFSQKTGDVLPTPACARIALPDCPGAMRGTPEGARRTRSPSTRHAAGSPAPRGSAHGESSGRRLAGIPSDIAVIGATVLVVFVLALLLILA